MKKADGDGLDVRGTMEAALAAVLERLPGLIDNLAVHEAAAKQERGLLATAKAEVAHLEKALKAYTQGPVKRGPRKPKAPVVGGGGPVQAGPDA